MTPELKRFVKQSVDENAEQYAAMGEVDAECESTS